MDGQWIFAATIAMWAAGAASILQIFMIRSPDHVMDEVFHVPQTQQYCRLEFETWDPKITTFPGTYIIAAVIGNISALLIPEPCQLHILRACNVALGVGVLCAISGIQRKLWSQSSSFDIACMAVAICSLPTHFFFQFLYYTDVAGVLFVLLAFLSMLNSQFTVSFLSAAAAILCRQTNAVWVAFVAGVAVLRDFSSFTNSIHGEESKGPSSPLQETLKLVAYMWQNKLRVLTTAWGHVMLIAAFAAFVVLNGGVAVGDRDAHRPTLHLAQLSYFSLFAAAAFSPLLMGSSMLIQDWRKKPREVFGDIVFLSSVFAAMIANGTIAHPYLLADNRHYTFYIWKNFLGRSPYVRVGLAPLYAASAYEVGCRLSRNFGFIYSFGFWACAAATLLPAGLLEFRYFTVPAFLFAVHVKPPRWYWSVVQFACFAAVNAATIYMFTERPFFWPDKSVARFMW